MNSYSKYMNAQHKVKATGFGRNNILHEVITGMEFRCGSDTVSSVEQN